MLNKNPNYIVYTMNGAFYMSQASLTHLCEHSTMFAIEPTVLHFSIGSNFFLFKRSRRAFKPTTEAQSECVCVSFHGPTDAHWILPSALGMPRVGQECTLTLTHSAFGIKLS